MLADHPAGTAGIRYGSAPGDLRSWHVLWALLAGYAWLMPTREPPWRSFYADALAAVAVAVLAVGLSVVHRRRGLPAPTAVPFMLFIACIPAVQVLAGMQFFAGSAWMASAYAFGFAVAILVGALWHEADADRAVDTLFLALAIPAVVTAAMMIYQWLGLDGMTMWVRPISASGRPAGNLGQPNQAAMLCMWGLIGLGWLCWRRKLHGALAASLGALLVAGMVLTQSRGIVLQAAALGVALLVWRRQLADRRLIVGLGLMALLYAGLFWGLHLLGREASEATLRPSDEMLQPGGRLLGWWYVVEALIRHPWAGYGWGQMTLAHYEVALDQPALREYFQYAHNIVLDILAWNGVPLGLLVLAGPAWWFVSRARRVADAASAFLMFMLVTVGAYALLEFPHAYALLLLPVGLAVGLVEARQPAPLPRIRASLGVLAMLVAVVWWAAIVRDYRAIETAHQQIQFELRRIGTYQASHAPNVLLLTDEAAFQRLLKTRIRAGMPPEDVELLRRVSALRPGGTLLMHYARAAALNGQPREAGAALARLCQLSPAFLCTKVLNAWADMAAQEPALQAVAVPVGVEQD